MLIFDEEVPYLYFILYLEVQSTLKRHKESILQTYSDQIMKTPIRKSSGFQYIRKRQEEVYVDLAILTGREYNQLWSTNERDYHIKQLSLLKDNITLKDLVKTEDKYLLVSGIAGIGKSELVNTVILKWAKGELFDGGNDMPKIELLIPIKCRELNAQIRSEDTSPELILHRLYPDLLKQLTMHDLREISHKTMFIVDGLDELLSVKQIEERSIKIKDPRMKNIVQFVHDLIVIEQPLLKHQYTVTVGRPHVTESIKAAVGRHSQVKQVHICGFSVENVKEYITRNCDEELRIELFKKLNNSRSLALMSRIPVYLWVICHLYHDNLQIKTPRTSTELMIYAALVFIRNHIRESNKRMDNLSFLEVCDNSDVLAVIMSLAKLSFVSLIEWKVVFDSSDIKSMSIDVEKLEKTTGLIVKVHNDEKGSLYQFKHLVLHEMFAGLYLFANNNWKGKYIPSNGLTTEIIYHNVEFDYYINTDSLRCCFPVVSCLEGLLVSTDNVAKPAVLKNFVQRLMKYNCTSFSKETSLKETLHLEFEKLLLQLQLRLQPFTLTGEDRFTQCMYEFDAPFSQSVINLLSNIEIFVNITSCLCFRMFFYVFEKTYHKFNIKNIAVFDDLSSFDNDDIDNVVKVAISSKAILLYNTSAKTYFLKQLGSRLQSFQKSPLVKMTFDYLVKEESMVKSLLPVLPFLKSLTLRNNSATTNEEELLLLISQNYEQQNYRLSSLSLKLCGAETIIMASRLAKYLTRLKIHFDFENHLNSLQGIHCTIKALSLSGELSLKELEVWDFSVWDVKDDQVSILIDLIKYVPNIEYGKPDITDQSCATFENNIKAFEQANNCLSSDRVLVLKLYHSSPFSVPQYDIFAFNTKFSPNFKIVV